VEFQYRTDMKNGIVEIGTREVESRLVNVRGQMVLLDRDVAELYSVETKRVNEAVKNNPDKFPHGYVIELTKDEASALRSKKSTLELDKKFADENFDRKSAISSKTRYYPKAFTERGLYMLATILKGSQAVETTIAIIDTFVQMREMARTMEQLQHVADGGPQQQTLLHKTGEILAEVIGRNLSTESTETEIELNFAVVKIKHKVIKKK